MKTSLKLIMAGIAALTFTSGAQAGDFPKELKKCKSCHTYDAAKPDDHKIGPNLHGVMGRKVGGATGFTKYSAALKKGGESGAVWTAELMDEFITDPKKFVKGKEWGPKSKMTKKFKKDKDRKEAIDFLAANAK